MSVIIPAYNAQRKVCGTLRSVRRYLDDTGLESEIIVVDDGSSDETVRCVERCGLDVELLRNGRNRGKGYAVRKGMLAARCAWTLFMDVDNSTTIDHLDRFAPHAAGADVLIASRRLDRSRSVRRPPAFRRMTGKTFAYLVRMLALPELKDTQCGFKVFRREVAAELFSRQRCEGFCFDVELLLIAKRLGCRTVEIPIDWDIPDESTVRLLRDPPRMFLDLLRIVGRHRPGTYRAPRRSGTTGE